MLQIKQKIISNINLKSRVIYFFYLLLYVRIFTTWGGIMNDINDVLILKPMLDVFDKKNIYNCFSYEVDSSNECRLYIDTTKLSFVNRSILYTIADVYYNIVSFGDDPSVSFVTYRGRGRKRSFFEKHRYACFHLPNFGEDFNDYMMGFFLEFSNCFVQQEPICLVENIYTKEEYERYKNYLSRGLEDKRNISVVVSLGRDNPLRNEESALKVAADRFCNGEVVSNLQVSTSVLNKNFTLDSNRALNNLKQYNLQKERESKNKEKVKTPNG